MDPKVNLNALHWLVILWKNEGRVTQTAEQIGISQPAVSQRIATLRKDFGDEIIVRDKRGVRLTRAGKILCEAAENALGLINLAEQRIKRLDASHAPEERLHVAYSPSHLTAVMKTLGSLLAERKALRVTLTEADPETTLQLLDLHDGPDLGVGYFSHKAVRWFWPMIVPPKPLALITNRRLNPRIAALRKIRAQDLTNEDLALLQKGPIRRTINGYFRRHRPKRIILESNTVASLLEAVRSGLASTILPELPEDGTLAVRRIEPLVAASTFVLLNKHADPSKLVMDFRNALAGAAEDLSTA
jgi:DNA-binding transcriptional LysR family regulator